MSENWVKSRALGCPEDGTLLANLGAEPVCLYNLGGKISPRTTPALRAGEPRRGFIEGEEIECRSPGEISYRDARRRALPARGHPHLRP